MIITPSLKEGQKITINLPFTYTIGETSDLTGKKIRNLADALHEVREEINSSGLENAFGEFDGEMYPI